MNKEKLMKKILGELEAGMIEISDAEEEEREPKVKILNESIGKVYDIINNEVYGKLD